MREENLVTVSQKNRKRTKQDPHLNEYAAIQISVLMGPVFQSYNLLHLVLQPKYRPMIDLNRFDFVDMIDNDRGSRQDLSVT